MGSPGLPIQCLHMRIEALPQELYDEIYSLVFTAKPTDLLSAPVKASYYSYDGAIDNAIQRGPPNLEIAADVANIDTIVPTSGLAAFREAGKCDMVDAIPSGGTQRADRDVKFLHLLHVDRKSRSLYARSYYANTTIAMPQDARMALHRVNCSECIVFIQSRLGHLVQVQSPS